jgi:hypothetical protein
MKRQSELLQKVAGGIIGLGLFVTLQVPDLRERLFQKPPFIMPTLLVVMALVFLPRYRKSARLHQEALELLSRGHIFAALEQLELSRKLARSRVVPTFNIALCRLSLWQLEAAEGEVMELLERKDLQPWFRGQVAALAALVAAVDGRLREAMQRMDEARELKSDSLPLAVLASAVFACRRGEWAEAGALLDRPECRELPIRLEALRDTLKAWCERHLGRERPAPEPLALLGEASPDKLEAAWPELMRFVQEGVRAAG